MGPEATALLSDIKMVTSRKVEALAEAIAKFSSYQDPASELHSLRNPGGLSNADGLRSYRSFMDGYQSLLHDLQVKLSGRSDSRLTGESTLEDLARARKEASPAVISRQWALFLRAALHQPDLSNKLQLKFFTE